MATMLNSNCIGQIGFNSKGSKMIISSFKSWRDITVTFDCGYSTKTFYSSFKNGRVKNPYDITVYGVGYLGEGKYKTKIKGKQTSEYKVWRDMLYRCYGKNKLKKHPSYIDCAVDPEWHNFQNFAAWYNKNIYEITGQRIELDKDILLKKNKIYSSVTCEFVSKDINVLFTNRKVNRGAFPVGVSFNKSKKKFESYCNSYRGRIYVGQFDTPEEAFREYSLVKKSIILEMAEKYQNSIPQKIYCAMINYKIEETD